MPHYLSPSRPILWSLNILQGGRRRCGGCRVWQGHCRGRCRGRPGRCTKERRTQGSWTQGSCWGCCGGRALSILMVYGGECLGVGLSIVLGCLGPVQLCGFWRGMGLGLGLGITFWGLGPVQLGGLWRCEGLGLDLCVLLEGLGPVQLGGLQRAKGCGLGIVLGGLSPVQLGGMRRCEVLWPWLPTWGSRPCPA